MKIKIDYTRSAQENADQCYRLSKKLKKKAEGAAIAIADLERKRSTIASKPVKHVRMKRIVEKRWYEKFNWFHTSNSMLAIGGRSALQNEFIEPFLCHYHLEVVSSKCRATARRARPAGPPCARPPGPR